MASLTISNDAGTEKFALEAGAVTLGRGLESDIRLKDIKSSRRHCQVVKAAEGYKLVDLGSGNGTYVNGILVDREHKLRNGDQIQIGGTTITFVDAPPAGKLPTASKPPTEADRKAAKDATSRVPAVQTKATAKTAATSVTKKTTAAVPTATAVPGKKTTSSIPVAGTGRVTKPATSKIQTTGGSTTRRGGTGKVPTASVSKTTKRTSMTERYTADIGKKKTNPMIFLIGGAVVALVAIVAVIMIFSGGGDLEYDRSQIKEKTAAAAKAIDGNEFDKGVALYEEAMKLAQKHKELGPQVESIKKSIEDAKLMKSDREMAFTDWGNLVKTFKESKYSGEGKDKIKEFLDRIAAIQKAHDPLGLPWCKADPKEGPEKSIKAMKEVVDAEYKEALASARREGFQAKRAEIDRQFLKEGQEDFAGALAAWQSYLDTTKDAEGKTKAPGAITDVHRRAFGSWDRVRKKADNTATSDKEAAAKILEEALPKFAGCKFNDTDIEAEIKAKIADLRK